MGLDNMPYTYPCELKKTAVRTKDNLIDCELTQESGGCPYLIEYEKSCDSTKGRVYGMLGTDCWYRGKFGNYLLDTMNQNTDDFESEMPSDFYGNGHIDGEEGINPETCLEMASVMSEYTSFIDNFGMYEDEIKEFKEQWQYAIWWLNFVGINGDGSRVWY